MKETAGMEMAYRERWEAEIAEMRRVLAGFAMKEEVEDDDGCRDEVRGVLQSAGYAVLEAADAEQALEVLLSDDKPEPTVIVLDMWLPRMSGLELFRLLRNYHRLARIPVVFTSASHVFADYAETKNVGWLPKPFDAETLLAEVNQRCSGEPSSSPFASSAG